MPMTRGATPATAEATTRAFGVRPYFFAASSEAMITAAAPSLMPEALPAVTVPSGFDVGLQLGQRFERRVRPRMLILIDDDRRTLTLWDTYRNDLLREHAVLHGRGCALLAAIRKGVLVFARDVELLGYVLCRLGHGVDAVHAPSSSD